MTAAPRRIDALDVSESVLLAELAAAHTADDDLAYREALYLVQHPEVRVSTLADYPGWVPPHTDPADFARSVRDGFEPAIDWTVDPPEPTRRPADCQPEFTAPKSLTGAQDVQTGGVL